MTEAEFFERFDRHIERFDQHIERFDRHIEQFDDHILVANEHMARGNEHMARGNELMDRLNEQFSDLRTFCRDLTRRNEVVLQGMMGELADMREQTQANTQALLKVLDRLEPQSG